MGKVENILPIIQKPAVEFQKWVQKSVSALAFMAFCISSPALADKDNSVIIVEREIIDNADLSLSNTLKHILRGDDDSYDKDKHQSPAKFLQTLLDTFKKTSFKASAPGSVDVQVEPSLELAALDPRDLLCEGGVVECGDHQLVPAAIFYRPDLTPRTYNHCGEFRIVYSFKTPVNSLIAEASENVGVLGRDINSFVSSFFLIFEMRPKNPHLKLGMKDLLLLRQGCQSIAKQWEQFRRKKDEDIASELNQFFYEKITGVDTDRAVKAEYLGFSETAPKEITGQIRGNFNTSITKCTPTCKTENTWQLREWAVHTSQGEGKKYKFVAQPLGDTPIYGLYLDKSTDNFSQGFKDNLQSKQGKSILGIDPDIKPYGVEEFKEDKKCKAKYATYSSKFGSTYVVNHLGIKGFDRKYLSFQSIISRENSTDILNPEYNDISKLKRKIGEYISKTYPQNHPVSINRKQFLVRAQFFSCAGCHRYSSIGFRERNVVGKDKVTRQEIRWKKGTTHRFTHVNEPGVDGDGLDESRLSLPLEYHFRPFRGCIVDVLISDPSEDIDSVDAKEKQKIIALNERVFKAFKQLRQTSNSSFAMDASNIPIIKEDMEKLDEDLRNQPGAFVQYRRTH